MEQSNFKHQFPATSFDIVSGITEIKTETKVVLRSRSHSVKRHQKSATPVALAWVCCKRVVVCWWKDILMSWCVHVLMCWDLHHANTSEIVPIPLPFVPAYRDQFDWVSLLSFSSRHWDCTRYRDIQMPPSTPLIPCHAPTREILDSELFTRLEVMKIPSLISLNRYVRQRGGQESVWQRPMQNSSWPQLPFCCQHCRVNQLLCKNFSHRVDGEVCMLADLGLIAQIAWSIDHF